jgi:hypothetical protein
MDATEASKPRRLFSDVEPPKKDTSSGVDVPSAAPGGTEKNEPPEADLAAGLGDESRKLGPDEKEQSIGGGTSRIGFTSGRAEKDVEAGTKPEGASVGSDEQASDAEEAREVDVREVDVREVDAREVDASKRRDSARSGSPRTGAGSRGGGGDADRADIALPDLAVERIDGDKSIMERSAETEARSAHPVTGIWEQVDGPRDPDFAPGGYERSVLMLNPALKAAAVYRVFRGDITMVVGGELALDAEPPSYRAAEGRLTIREDAASTSRFRRSPLKLGGEPAVTVLPPEGEGPWALEWRREGMELVVGDKRYAAITREAFEKVRRGGGDVATASDKSDRIAERSPEERARRINETSFFGLRGGGKRICFIVDVSGSMAGGKIERLKQELVTTIQSLNPDTRFSVVFFDSGTHTVAQTWLHTDADRQRAIQVINSQLGGTGTDPTGAFQFAFGTLNPLPDCIYYMTDGQTRADVVGLLRSLNGGKVKTTVHAIAFGDRSLETVMQQIATENNGAYLFVP